MNNCDVSITYKCGVRKVSVIAQNILGHHVHAIFQKSFNVRQLPDNALINSEYSKMKIIYNIDMFPISACRVLLKHL